MIEGKDLQDATRRCMWPGGRAAGWWLTLWAADDPCLDWKWLSAIPYHV